MKQRKSQPDLEAALADLTREFENVGSIAPLLQHRLSNESMLSRRSPLPLILAMSLMVIVGSYVAWHITRSPKFAPVVAAQPSPTLQLDDVTVIQHLAGIIDPHTILVAWTCRFTDVSQTPAAALEPRRYPNYTEIPLRAIHRSDGNVFFCSIFVPEPAIDPAYRPPTITVQLPDHRLIRFGTSPAHFTPAELERAIRAASPTDMPPISQSEIDAAERRFSNSNI